MQSDVVISHTIPTDVSAVTKKNFCLQMLFLDM